MAVPEAVPTAGIPVAGMAMPSGAGGGIRIVLKNAKISIDQVIVKREEE